MCVASKLTLQILVAAGENVECAIIKDMRDMYLHAAELASYCVSLVHTYIATYACALQP